MDLATDDGAALARLREQLPNREIFAISGASHAGLEPLLDRLWEMLILVRNPNSGGEIRIPKPESPNQ
jgi:hypothetical protein